VLTENRPGFDARSPTGRNIPESSMAFLWCRPCFCQRQRKLTPHCTALHGSSLPALCRVSSLLAPALHSSGAIRIRELEVRRNKKKNRLIARICEETSEKDSIIRSDLQQTA
jgi:hypothetical protein